MKTRYDHGEWYLKLDGDDYWTSESLVKQKYIALEIWYKEARRLEKEVEDLKKELNLLKNPPPMSPYDGGSLS